MSAPSPTSASAPIARNPGCSAIGGPSITARVRLRPSNFRHPAYLTSIHHRSHGRPTQPTQKLDANGPRQVSYCLLEGWEFRHDSFVASGAVRPTEGEFCWARTQRICAAGLGHIASIAFAALALAVPGGLRRRSEHEQLLQQRDQSVQRLDQDLRSRPSSARRSQSPSSSPRLWSSPARTATSPSFPPAPAVAPTRCAAICSPRARRVARRSPISGT